MQEVNRKSLLRQLETVQAGLSSREIIEQTTCLAFDGGNVSTYNDEIACIQKCDLSGITCVVQGQPLLQLLKRLPDDAVRISISDSEFRVKGKKRESGIRTEASIKLPFDQIEKPTDWRPLPKDFADAVFMASQCVSKNQAKFSVTCVHIAKKWIEGCDNYQLARYKIKTGFAKPTLVRGQAIKHIVSLDMTEISETKNWLHLRNKTGLRLSIRRYVDEYPDFTATAKTQGKTVTLPTGLSEVATTANIFATDNIEPDRVFVTLDDGKAIIRGEGPAGWYQETKKIDYRDDRLEFSIAVQLLHEITKRSNTCQISQTALKVQSEKLTYVTSVGKRNEPKDDEK